MKPFHVTFSQLEILVAIVDAGSFSEAALRIHMTQSALSHAVAKLESDLGVQILIRSRKGLSLTPIGLEVLTSARLALEQAHRIQVIAQQEKSLVQGRLRLGHVHSLNSILMAGILEQFEKLFPDVELQLFEATAEELPQWLKLSVVDIGILLHPTEGIQTEFLLHDEIIAMVPYQHPLAQEPRITLPVLVSENLLLPPIQHDFIRYIFEPAGVEPQRIIPVTDIRTIMEMVKEGIGVSLNARSGLPEDLSGIKRLSLTPPIYVQFGIGFKPAEPPSHLAIKFKQLSTYWAQTQTHKL